MHRTICWYKTDIRRQVVVSVALTMFPRNDENKCTCLRDRVACRAKVEVWYVIYMCMHVSIDLFPLSPKTQADS